MKSFAYVILTLIISGCNSQFPPENNNQPEQEIIEEHDYHEVEHLRIFWSEIFKQSGDTYYVYLYSETCSHCSSIKNVMIDKALKDDETIYFVSSSFEHNIADTGSTGVKEISKLYIRGYPTLLKLEEKTVVLNVSGTVLIREELNLK